MVFQRRRWISDPAYKIRVDSLDEKQVLDFRAILTDVQAEQNTICYTIKTKNRNGAGWDDIDERQFSIKELIRKFLGILGKIDAQAQKTTFSKAMNLSYGTVKELDPEMSDIHFEKTSIQCGWEQSGFQED